ncbi:hypothetical protein ABTM49_19715, partial [Acinetobacter baumannii]
SDVPDFGSRREQGCRGRAVQQMPRPEARILEGTEKTSQLALPGERTSEPTRASDPVTEHLGRIRGLAFHITLWRCFT